MHSHFAFFRNGSWATVCKYITAHRACGCPTSHSSRIVMLPKRGYYIFMEKTDNGMTQFIWLHCLQNRQLKPEFCSALFWEVSLTTEPGKSLWVLHKPSQWLKTKTPNPQTAFRSMRWLNARGVTHHLTLYHKIYQGRNLSWLRLTSKDPRSIICNKRWHLQRWKWFLKKCSSPIFPLLVETHSVD